MTSAAGYLSDDDRTRLCPTNEQSTTENRGKGLSVTTTSLLIAGSMSASGIQAVPIALAQAGWSGVVLLIACGCTCAFTGHVLGRCWTVVRRRYPECAAEEYTSDPYPTIALLSAGEWARTATRVLVTVTSFSVGTVFLLMIAQNCSNLLESLAHFDVSLCGWTLITGVLLLPLTLLGTPKDLWWTGVVATATNSLGTVFIVASLVKDPRSEGAVTHSTPTFDSFARGFGTILYAFGASAVFPTLQVDMKNPDSFPRSVVIGLTAVLAMYVSVAVAGFVQLGDHMTKLNILEELAKDWLLYSVIVLTTVSLVMVFPMLLSPIYQDLEGVLKIPNQFSWKRTLLRFAVVALMLFVALSVPRFGIVLSLVGGTTIAALTFVFPPFFYMLLVRQRPGTSPRRHRRQGRGWSSGDSSDERDGRTGVEPLPWQPVELSSHVKILLVVIMAVGVSGGIASIYSAARSLADGASGFTVPCYVNVSAS